MKSFMGITKLISILSIAIVLASCGGAEERKVKYLEKGKAYLAEENYDKARVELKNVLQIDPKHAEAYYILGEIEEKSKDIPKAYGLFNKALELDNENVKAKLKVARLLLYSNRSEDTERSLKYVNEVLSSEKNNIEAAFLNAAHILKRGDKEKAIVELERIVNKDSSRADAVSMLAAVYLNQNKYEQAISIFEKGIADNKDNVALRMGILKVYIKNNDKKNIVRIFKELVQIQPDNMAFYMNLANYYVVAGEEDRAIDLLRSSISKSPEDPKRYLALAEILAKTKGFLETEKHLKNSIAEKPELDEIRFGLAELYNKTNNVNKANEVYLNIIDQDRNEKNVLTAKALLADNYLKSNNIQKAIELVSEILDEESSYSKALLVKSKISLKQNDVVEAINSLRVVLKGEPDNAEAAILLSRAHKISGDKDLAEEVLREASVHNLTDPNLKLEYSRALAEAGKIDQALRQIDYALTKNQPTLELISAKSELLAASGDIKNAEKILLDLLNKYPENSGIHKQLGALYNSSNETDKALSAYEKQYKHDSNKVIPLRDIVRIYLKSKDYDTAITRAKQAINETPDSVEMHELLGELYIYEKDVDLAKDEFNISIKLDQSRYQPYMKLAGIYLLENNHEKAEKILNDGLKELPDNIRLNLQLAAIYEKSSRFENAIQIYQRIVDVNPNNKLALNNLASLLIDHRNNDESLNAVRKLLVGFENINQPAFKDTLGWFYVKNGENDKAVKVLEEVVKNAPKVAIFKYHLGVAYSNTGDNENAKKHLAEAVGSKQEFQGKQQAIKLLSQL